MTIPPRLQAGIDEIVRTVPSAELEASARALSDSYRGGGSGAARAARSATDVAAYLATRAPATYAAVEAVCREIQLVRPGWAPASVLDLGAGPGIASWAALAAWPGIAHATLVEAEREMARAGQELAARGPEALQRARWQVADASAGAGKADLVIASYLLGELDPPAVGRFVERAWALAADTLVIVEPGTTAGYERVLAARGQVLAAGGSTLAPCPHDAPCPLALGDWCHFGVRLARSRNHRVVKGAERNFEDEKFAYAALARSPAATPEARIVRRPEQNPGHVVFSLCTSDGLERRTVSRKQKDAYREARKRAWGDSL
jgi:ribosomal protein RSM22 (predicted rRNA methylase)